ncbi:MAG: type II secretion system F family protein [Methylophagaceae bacterium]
MGKENNSNIFHDLAALSGAGIAMLEAAQIIASSHVGETGWPAVISCLEKGNSLAQSLGESGLINRYEQEIISVAEFTGRTEQALVWLTRSHEKRARRVNQLKYKLILPFSVLLIGVIASSILTLIKSPNIAALPVLGQAVFILATVAIITKVALYFLQKDVSNFIANIGLFSHLSLYKHLFEQMVFGALVWNIKAGIDFKTGFISVSELINSKALKNQLVNTSRYCGQGIGVTESIKQAKLPITSEFMQVLNIAEVSGRWEKAVEHYLKQKQELVDLKIDSAIEWAPRIYYVLVVVFVSSILL